MVLNRASGIGHRASGIGHRASGIGHRASGIGHRLVKKLSFFDKTACWFKLLVLSVLWMVSYYSHGILSNTSQRSIMGNAPEIIVLPSLLDSFGFSINNEFYSQSNNNIAQDMIKLVDGNLTFNDFKQQDIHALLANFDIAQHYYDQEGDPVDLTEPFTIQSVKHIWYDNKDQQIPESDFSKIIGCGSGYSMPLKLNIKVTVSTQSQFGSPRQSEPVTLSKSYQIAPISELCYAKPNSSIVLPEKQWNGVDKTTGAYYLNQPKYSTPDPLVGGGYTQDFVPYYGFKAEPVLSDKKFPTTGFPGAKFQLVMTGAQTDYRFELLNNPGQTVTIDQNGMVKLNAKPSGAINIRATLLRDNSITHDYVFNPISLWIEPQNLRSNFDQALQRCGGLQNMLAMEQLTNSPRYQGAAKDIGTDVLTLSNTYTRAIGNSVLGEWGWTTKTTYPDSQWQDTTEPFKSRYWTSNVNTNYTYVVHSHDGFVGTFLLNDPELGYAVCKQ